MGETVKFHELDEWNEQGKHFGKLDCFCNVADLGAAGGHYFITINASERTFVYKKYYW